ncbi:MAG: hydantoinase B/oxoprolinase family protein [Caulobacterales bacterium]|nr:hydantoinase B/oxoprolinase family protein [Caulobacterales bacterium]
MAAPAKDSDLWEFWIDRGGTFTDVIARAPGGRIETLKLLSESKGVYEDAAVEAVRRLMGLAHDAPVPGARIAAVKMGTTVATNALLERRGAATAFVTTEGFGDLLDIGDQARPDIFALDIEKPTPLHSYVVEARERLNVWGDVLTPLDEERARAGLTSAREAGCEAAAICLMHACRSALHEERLAVIADELGFTHISVSSRVDPLMKFLARARTTLADAYLTPVVRRYARQLAEQLGGAPLLFMTSAGGLVDAGAVTGRQALLSGPAGGVVGMAKTALQAGFPRVVGFDMGGTSTDVSRFDGEEFERLDAAEVGGWRVRAPMLAVHTVAAGGGSVLRFDGERARVGPESAGADPGPSCYGLGGPLTVTDANVLLGRLDSRFFPAVFGPAGDRSLNVDVVRRRFAKLAYDMDAPSPEACAAGFLDVAIESMAQAVKRISVEKGYDAPAYALSSFGGAGGQVACRVADALGMTTVIVHPHASLLSALGVGVADQRVWQEGAVERALDGPGAAEARARVAELEAEAREELRVQGADTAAIHTRAEARLRYQGSDTALPIPLAAAGETRDVFEAAHRRLFGFAEEGRAIIVESVGVEARAAPPGAQDIRTDKVAPGGGPYPAQLAQMFVDGAWRPCPVCRLSEMAAGAWLHGPALIVEPNSQIVVEQGWRGARRADGILVLERMPEAEEADEEAVEGAVATPAPAELELFNKRFMSVAEQMGATLEKTAHSVNIKERLDFSCAVFDAEGGLVANAPHMPVHLGSMSASVRAVIERHPDLKTGDAVALNDPDHGGTHLPDVTVIAPVLEAAGGERLFFVAARGHHADIGGAEPGSMPPFSTTRAEEGITLDALKILSHGAFQEREVRLALTAGPSPARDPMRNIADLKAQLAACARGAEALKRLIADHGRARVQAFMGHVQANAEAAVRRVLANLPDGRAAVALDDGARIEVAVRVDRRARAAVIDFAGTSPQQESNFNAPLAVTRAAVLYVFRCLVGDDIPLNEGCLTPLDIRVPPGSLLDPEPGAPVVAGNVETSQHIVDALLAATGALAASQGTMNNLTFGDERHQYYETICGGAGAGAEFDGASAVHTHMTNSRLTDPEILELRFPVLVEAHSLRRGSGGAGGRRGGDGVVRRLRFLDSYRVSLLSSRRRVAPPGLAGGSDGAPGAQRLIAPGGGVTELDGRFQLDVGPGDVVEIETPGGGGYGEGASD